MPSDPIIATVGTPTPMKFQTIYAVQQQGASYLSMCAARRTDAERVLRQSPGSRLVTIPGETDAAPQPAGDVLAAADAMAEAVASLIRSVEGSSGSLRKGSLGHDAMKAVLSAYYAARNATTNKETPDANR